MSCEKCKQRREAARKALLESVTGVKSAAAKIVKAVAKTTLTQKRGSKDE